MSDMQPAEIDDATVAFPAMVGDLMPSQEDIPEEFKQFLGTKWNQVFSDWFYFGLKGAKWQSKEGINQDKALRHIGAVMGSYEPKHEYKEAAAAYLMSLWFEDVKYKKGERDKQ